jgi:hypothetical protein
LPQSTAAAHWPLLHDCTPLPEHCDVPARQTPEHCVPMQVPVVHGTPAAHAPVAPHVSRPSEAHWTAPGVQTPWHDATPDATAHAWFVQAVDVPQLPLALHVWTPLLEHCVVPGAQTPLQPPATQA